MSKETPNQDWREWMRGLGRQARRIREFLGLSQEQIARLAGVSQGAVSRLEGGRGLATPLLVVVKLNVAMRRALSAYDPELLSDEARQILNHDDRLIPDGHRFAEYPMASDAGIEELVHLYRGLPERQREKLLGVVRATAAALSPSDSDSELRAVRSRHAS
jgi:transcriptional regulator with XRE-family HTH domain